MSYRNLVSSRGPACALTGVSLLLAASGLSAANWELVPRAQAGYTYNDNYRLNLPGDEIEVSGGEAEAELTLRTVDPRTHFEITPRISGSYFPGESEENSTNYYLRSILNDQAQRRRAGFLFDFSREDVVRSELPSPNVDVTLGQPGVGDAGRTLQRNRRNFFNIAPYYSYDLSQRYRMELEAHYLQARFDEQFSGSQEDFSELGASAGLGYQLSQRNSLTFRANALRYETTFKTKAYGAQAEWDTDYSETSRLYIRLGGQQTRPEGGKNNTSFVGGIGGQWHSQRNTLFLDLTRSVSPIAAGTVVERHQLRMRIDHDVSPRLALLFGARASRDEGIGASTYPTRKYATADAGFEWRMQRFLSLTATYNYRWQEYADQPSDTSANGFQIGIAYEPKRPD